MSDNNYQQLPTKARPNYQQEQALIEARVAFMRFCPFFCYYFYDQMEEYHTLDASIPTLATDGRRVFVNLNYLMTLSPLERAFAFAHEVNHVILKHPQRAMHYAREGNIQGLPYDPQLFNMAMDYPINAHLVDTNVGACNPAWLYDRDIKASELAEDVYKKLYKNPPPPPPGGGGKGPSGNQPGQPGDGTLGQRPRMPDTTGSGSQPQQPTTYGDTRKGGGRPDKQAQQNQGRFDEVLPPRQDAATGKEDLPSEIEFREAVARAAAAAKAIGKLPGSLQRTVDDILEPQVQWRDHIRMLLTGKLGHRRETWDTPNRRRIVLNPAIYLPGRRGYGAEDVTVVIDNSGSVSNKEMVVFFSEVSAILADCRPKKVRVIWCDAAVRRVEEARVLDELADIRVAGSKGGGGTDFKPPFAWLLERDIRPDTLIYLTDMMGPFPTDPKTYPVVWCATSSIKAPFGETVHVEVK